MRVNRVAYLMFWPARVKAAVPALAVGEGLLLRQLGEEAPAVVEVFGLNMSDGHGLLRRVQLIVVDGAALVQEAALVVVCRRG